MIEQAWDIDRIRAHIAADLPVAAVFGIDIVAAQAASARVRLVGTAPIRRPGGSIAGPVLFAMADIATYALTLALRQEDVAVTSSLAMNFLRPGFALPLIGEAVPLRAGRNLLTYDVRIWSEAEGPDRPIAQATATWTNASVAPRP